MATSSHSDVPAAANRSRLNREIVTPEGVPLEVTLADRAQRVAAFAIDMLIVGGILIGLVILIGLAGDISFRDSWILSFFLLAAFFLRNFYFAAFELRWQGATPGKRAVGLRVIDRGGAALQADAVMARNFMREIEIFLPLSLVAAAPLEVSDRWLTISSLVWASLFLLMPFFNRDNLRVGDMVAGTWVIIAPKAALLSDMAQTAAAHTPQTAPDAAAFRFTATQLDTYGAYELQVLEEVLRGKSGLDTRYTEQEVCRHIARKIGWATEIPTAQTRRFLADFYAALRAHLESRMLMGHRRQSKHDR